MNAKVEASRAKNLLWNTTAKGMALVSGVFTLIVACMLIQNYLVDQWGLPDKELLYSEELAQKKLLLDRDPRNETLKQEIRSLDLALRRDYFLRRQVIERGKYLLLAGTAIFLLASKRVASGARRKRSVRRRTDRVEIEIRTLTQSRNAVVGFGFIVLAGVMILAFMPSVDLGETQVDSAQAGSDRMPAEPEYPAWEVVQMNWPYFRGPGGHGVSIHEKTPLKWNETNHEGILWKSEVPLPGHNSPIVWGDRVFLSGANETGKEVFCYAAQNGELLWRGSVSAIPAAMTRDMTVFADTGYAASSMACDGTRVYAIFVDGDLGCFTLDGQSVWMKNLGIPENTYSFATSLIVYQNLLLIQYDQGAVEDNLSMMLALDGRSGQVVWQTKRPVANTWTTPVLIDTGQGMQLITCSEPWVIAYNPLSGEELWRADLLGSDLVPSAAFAQGLVLAVKPYESLFALRPSGRGDVTETHLAWSAECNAPDVCSPVTDGARVYLMTSTGLLSSFDVQTGALVWEHEFNETFQASPCIAGGRLYLISQQGNAYTVKTASTFELGETSSLNASILATPAFLDDRIYIRGENHLYGIGYE